MAAAIPCSTSFTGGDADGYSPFGSLTLADGKLYGMTSQGGNGVVGTVFSMNTDGSGFGLLHNFGNGVASGEYPSGSLTFSGGKLYGMTTFGGIGSDGTIFSMNPDGSGFSLLHSFVVSIDGEYPYGSLTLSGGKLYGMTSQGGGGYVIHGNFYSYVGTIFSMNTDGSGFSLLHAFTGGAADGFQPFGSLTLSGGKLYGMTSEGGSAYDGTVFSMNPDGSGFSLLHSFAGGAADGYGPRGSLTLSGGKLYGTTYFGGSANDGTVFSINPDGSGFTLLQSFAGQLTDGAYPHGDVTVSADGSTLYGMTTGGGTANNGVAFSLSTGVPEPTACALVAMCGLLLTGQRRRS